MSRIAPLSRRDARAPLRHPPMPVRLGALLLLCAVAPVAPAATYYVGTGEGCHATLTAALGAAAGDPDAEIRLTYDTLHRTPQQTINRSLVLRGGYANCSAATPTPGQQSLLYNPDGRTLLINGITGVRRQVLAEQVTFIGQRYWNGSGTAPGGIAGGIRVTGPVDLRLRRGTMQVVHASTVGGAIRMESTAAGAPKVALEDMEITLASSETHGGAVYCHGGRLELLRSSIGDSHAGSDGGAIYAADGCHVELTDGALRDNSGGIGGAVYLGGTLSAHRVLIAGNSAASAGGGIGITRGSASLQDVKFIDNRSIGGAALSAFEGGVLMGGRMCTLAEAVSRTGPRCSSISKHAVGLDQAVVSLRGQSVMSLTNTTLTDNSSTAAWANLIRSRESDLVIQNSVLAANSKLKPAYVESDTDRLLLLEQVSFHGNTAGGPGNSHFYVTGSAHRFLATNSILMFNGYPLLESNTSVVLRCIVADQPVSAYGGMLRTDDPGIADDGVHLRGDSVAIDFCEPNLITDGDGDNRPFDVPTVPNPSATRIADAGADEYHPGSGAERIHSDGFES